MTIEYDLVCSFLNDANFRGTSTKIRYKNATIIFSLFESTFIVEYRND